MRLGSFFNLIVSPNVSLLTVLIYFIVQIFHLFGSVYFMKFIENTGIMIALLSSSVCHWYIGGYRFLHVNFMYCHSAGSSHKLKQLSGESLAPLLQRVVIYKCIDLDFLIYFVLILSSLLVALL